MKMHVRNLIVGGGVAGLYIAMQLHERNEPFLMLEAQGTSSWSPRNQVLSTRKLYSVPTVDGIVEMGASVFHSQQPKLLRLLKSLLLDHKIQPLSSVSSATDPSLPFTRYVLPDKLRRQFSRYQLAQVIDTTRSKLARHAVRFPDLTVKQAAKILLSPKEYLMLKLTTSGWYEVEHMNVVDYARSNEIESSAEFFLLEDGLEQILHQGWMKFFKRCWLNSRVTTITYDESQKLGQWQVTCERPSGTVELNAHKLFVCVSHEHLLSFSTTPRIERLLSQISAAAFTLSSLRVYIIVKYAFLLSRVSKYTVGNVLGQWWIRVKPRVVMVYCDGIMANALNLLTDEELQQRWIDDANRVYADAYVRPLKISDIRLMIRSYYPNAITLRRSSPSSDQAVQELQNMNCVVTALPVPDHQAWIEGHLYDV